MHDLRPQHGKNITRSYDWEPWTPRLDLREVYEAGPEIPKVLPVRARLNLVCDIHVQPQVAMHAVSGSWCELLYMAMDQYLYIPFLGGWTSIYQLFDVHQGDIGFWPIPI